MSDLTEGRLNRAKQGARFIVHDLVRIRNMVHEGAIARFSNSFMHAKFRADALGYVRVWFGDDENTATAVASPRQGCGDEIKWEIGREPPDGDHEVLYVTDHNYAGTYIAMMFMREEIFNAFDNPAYDPD